MSIQFVKFAQLTWGESFWFWIKVLTLPVKLVQGLVCLPFVSRCGKSRKRHILDLLVRQAVGSLNGRQLQKLLGSDERTYRMGAWFAGTKPLIEAVPRSPTRRIHWMGQRPEAGSEDRVVVYLHGGGFALPLQVFALPFFTYVQRQVSKHLKSPAGSRKPRCSIAIVEYTLATEAPWPAPLREASAAIQHLIDTGTPPSNIIIAGDSAGANLTYQVLQHILNPRVPTLHPMNCGQGPDGATLKFAGVFFISPWFDLEGTGSSFRGKIHAKADIVPENFLLHCGSTTLSGLTPDNEEEGRKWLLGQLRLDGVQNLVERVLVYGGGQERLIDGILKFTEDLRLAFGSQEAGAVKLLVDEFGVHDDLFFEMIARRGPNETTKKVVRWLCDTFDHAASA